MIGKILSHIGKNPRKARGWQTGVVCSKYSWGESGRWSNPRKILQILPSFKLGNRICSFKLLQNYYLNKNTTFS